MVWGMETGRGGGAKGTRQTGEHNLLTSDNEPTKHIDVVKLTEHKTA